MRKSKRQDWYRGEYLASNHWKKVKDKVWKKQYHCCDICDKRYSLQFHHLSYERLGKEDEWEDIVILCSTHHFLCHYTIFGRVPTTKRTLTKRYKALKRNKLRRLRPSHIFSWIGEAYRIAGHQERKWKPEQTRVG